MDQIELENTIVDLKDKIRKAENQENTINGAIESLDDQLKNVLNCDSLENVEVKIKAINQNLENIDKQIQNGIKELENLPEFNNLDYDEDLDY